MTDLEAAADLARANRDAAIARETALFALIEAFRALEAAASGDALTAADRLMLAPLAGIPSSPYFATLRAVRVLGEEIRGPLTDRVCEAEAALNAAEVAS